MSADSPAPAETFTCLASDRWWLRPDPSAFVRLRATDSFCQALRDTGGSLLVTSRQQGRVAMLSVAAGGGVASVTTVPGPMGAAPRGTALALGTYEGIRIYQNIAAPGEAGLYVPAAMHYTGSTGIHEVEWDSDGQLWFVNTRFSALSTLDPLLHFRALWRPFFVPELVDADCCHLNGMAMADGRPEIVTALGMAGDRDGWRRTAPDDGIAMRTDQTILRRGLSLPHSPVVRDEGIWLLESGWGRIILLSRDGRDESEVRQFDGIVRGLVFAGEVAFLGLSHVRPNSGAVSAIIEARMAGPETTQIHALDPRSGRTIGHAELPFVGEISSITFVPVPQARLLDASVDEMSRTWLFAEGEPDGEVRRSR